jgi:hypothetical protein
MITLALRSCLSPRIARSRALRRPTARTGGYSQPAQPEKKGRALMAETLDAEQYRQALRLILSELEDLDTAHPVDIGYRLGELKVHLRTRIGESGRPPMVGLRGLEDLARVRKDSSGRPPHNRSSVDCAPDLRQRGGLRWSPCWRILLRQLSRLSEGFVSLKLTENGRLSH